MTRSFDPEILDDPGVPDAVLDISHRDLIRTHRYLGHTWLLLRELRRHPGPLRRVMDVGCGRGGLLKIVRRKLGVEVVGVDLRVPPGSSVPIVGADAVRDPLPECDVALAVCLVHHLSETELADLIRNVGRSARRFIVLDLVRHPLPLFLFRIFVAPFLYSVNGIDGIQSIRRSFTGREMRAVVDGAVQGSGATVRHRVAPLWLHQMVDIRWR
jgi:SAM-dependent methyltransferase